MLLLLALGACSRTTIVAVEALEGDAAPPITFDAAPDLPPLLPGPDLAAPPPDAEPPRDVPPPDLGADAQADPSLIGYWPFEEGEGTRVGDRSGRGNDGALMRGDPDRAWVPGKVGRAMSVGRNAWVQVPSSPSIDSPAQTNALTISAWIFTNSVDRDGFNFVVSRQLYNGPLDNFGLAVRNGHAAFAIVTDFPAGRDFVPLGRWIHVAATFQGGLVRVFVDGVEVTSQQTGRKVVSQTRPLLISGNQNSSSPTPKEFFDGAIDEVRFYNRALDRAEIAALAR